MSEILRIEQIVVAAGDRQAPILLLDDVSLTLDQGQVLGLIGESGAGKTTLGLAALGHVRRGGWIAGGRILYRGEDILAHEPEKRRSLLGQRIAYVAQSAAAAFNPARTILDQVSEGPIEHGLATPATARRQAVDLFAELDLPAPERFGDRYPHQVSGGQLQRAMLAMAMACRPDILILDEPTTALDVTTQIEVLAALKNLIRDHGSAGLYISHDLAVVGQMADRLMILRHGRMVEAGETRQILEAPAEAYTRELVSIRRQAPSRHRGTDTALQPLLAIAGVGASYGGRSVVADVSLTVAHGETCAIVGESGSGKSTLARIICGLKPAETGEIRLDGLRLAPRLEDRSKRDFGRIQLIYQSPDMALNPLQTIEMAVGRPLALCKGLRGGALAARVRGLLDMMELPAGLMNRYPGQLSGGQKQRVCIARALAADPNLLICDEITASLDPIVADGIVRLLRELQERTRVAYLFITHDLEVVRKIAHQVMVMENGAVCEAGPLDTVFSPPFHPYTAKLLASIPQMRVGWLDDAIAARARPELPSGLIIPSGSHGQ